MTSKLTRERLAEIAQFGFSSAITPANDFEIKELARMALAAMDSKPVFFIEVEGDDWINAGRIEGENRPDLDLLPDGINYLYAAPQPLTDAEQEELQERRKAAMDSEPVAWMHNNNNIGIPAITTSQKIGQYWMAEFKDVHPLYRHAQPVPVVLDEVTAEDCPAFVKYDVTEVDEAWARGFNSCRAAMLAAAPQPQNAPQNIPEIIPDCWCRTCRPVVLNDMRFVVCPDCGNKRCPRANDHRNACTGSNEPGQEGSAYPDARQEVKP